MTPALKAARGSKRRCRNEACGLRFYDLNRGEIVCPNCGSIFVDSPNPPQQSYRGAVVRVARRREAEVEKPDADSPNKVVAEELPDEEGAAERILEVDESDDALDIEIESGISEQTDE